MKKIIGIILADNCEFIPFEQLALKHDCKKVKKRGNSGLVFNLSTSDSVLEIHAVESGVGKVNAAMAASSLIFDDNAEMIFNCGLSGAVTSFKRGDIVVGTSYVECDFDLRIFDLKLGEKTTGEYVYSADNMLLENALKIKGIKSGRLGTGDFFLADEERKELYKKEFNINAFDMESGAIAAVCNKNNIPFLSIRKTSDDSNDCAFDDYRNMNELKETSLSEILFEMFEQL